MSEEEVNVSAEVDNDIKADEIAEKLYKIFTRYVSICSFGLFLIILAYAGLLWVMAMWLVNVFRLSYYHRQLKRLGSKVLFMESGVPLAISLLLVLTFPLSFPGLSTAMFGFSQYDSMGARDLGVTYRALEKYAEKNNGSYPQQNWREELVFYEDNKHPFDEKDYVCLNPAALSLGSDMPDNMVLGYRAYEECKAVGLFDPKEHYRYNLLWIVTGDGNEKPVSLSQLSLLRWDFEDESELKLNYAGISFICIIVFLVAVGVFIKFRKIVFDNIFVILGQVFLAVLAGAIFGGVSLKYYSGFCNDYYGGSPLYQAVSVGIFMAVMFAMVYLPLMIYFRRRSSYYHTEPWITVYGSITGIMCSCAVHMVLRYICFENSFIPVIAGIPFGAWVGMVVGRQTGIALDDDHNKRSE